MNWVSPIKDDETIEKFKRLLREAGDKYLIMFEIGVGTGLQLQDILNLKVKDVLNKNSISVSIGSKNIERSYKVHSSLKKLIKEYTRGKSPESYLITGHSNSTEPLSREQAYRTFKNVGKTMGLSSIGAQTMRKTFAWKYYKETGDIYYLQNLFNHASPSITYRYIGEKPNVEVVLKKMSPEENERSRYLLYLEGSGKKRISSLIKDLENIRDNFDNPANNDAFYGKLDCLLDELDELMKNYNETK